MGEWLVMKKYYMKIIDIAYFGILIVNSIIKVFGDLFGDNAYEFKEVIEILGWKGYIVISLFLVGVFLLNIVITALFNMFYLTVVYIGIKIANRKYNKEILDKVDFKNDDYYRDIISKYSAGVLSYIDDFEISEKDVIATIMSLELKGKLKVEEKIKILNDDCKDLEKNEKYILNTIKNEENIDIRNFEAEVIRDCIDNELLKQKDIKKETDKDVIIFFIIMFVAIPICTFISMMSESIIASIISFLMILSSVVILFCHIAKSIAYWAFNTKNPYIRSKEAKEINTKFEGLKKYIKDYSLLDEKNYEDIVIWKNYLIYSIIMGQNPEIVENVKKKINWQGY